MRQMERDEDRAKQGATRESRSSREATAVWRVATNFLENDT